MRRNPSRPSSCGLLTRIWRIPDRRTPGSLLNRGRIRVRQFSFGLESVVGAPAASGVFQHARIIERTVRRLEVRIAPDSAQFRGTLVFRVAAIGQTDFCPVVGATGNLGVRLYPFRAKDAVDLLLGVTYL